MDMRGRQALVTGGAKGLGLAIVEALLAKEAEVTIFDLDAVGLAEARERHPALNCVTCDVSDYAQVQQALAQYHAEHRAADLLINNAGILYSAPLVKFSMSGLEKHSLEMWHKTLAVNLNAVFYMTAGVVEKMIATRTKGVILNISSISASGNAGQSAYSASKAAVNALTATWSKELGAMGIRVAALAPGFSDTDSTRAALSEALLQETIKKVPLRRLGKPEEIAQGALSIIENDFFNGKVYELDGGLVL